MSPYTILFIADWDDRFCCYILQWTDFYEAWISFKKPMLLLRYEDLQTNLTAQLYRISDFLRLNYSQQRVTHTLQNSEGQYHRAHHTYNYADIYRGEKGTLVKQTMKYTNDIIAAKFHN